jgi:hypothetical protein
MDDPAPLRVRAHFGLSRGWMERRNDLSGAPPHPAYASRHADFLAKSRVKRLLPIRIANGRTELYQ